MASANSRPDRLHLLGIRHHGPGSARGVLAALEASDPAVVLVEGPPDADAMIAFAASPEMRPPVALLVHAEADPANASFYPFAVFSPEWQAMRWALAKGRPVRFIDLPSANRLALRAEAEKAAAGKADDDEANDVAPSDTAAPDEPDGQVDTTPAADTDAQELATVRRDPLAYLARIAGYDDSEAWWNALIEQGAQGPEIFAALETAIGALRDTVDLTKLWPEAERLVEQQREAHMRLEIARALTETDGNVAVVCGAWHVPALRQKVPAKDDRALLKGLPKVKVVATWVPWTETRLAAATGYGAGVISPGWYAHLWDEMERLGSSNGTTGALAAGTFAARWQTRVAGLLRKHGRPASTASVIEASRLATTLAALRDLALPGLEEMQEASLATLCEGERAPFALIEAELVIGKRVGEIDERVPQMPLAADLARWQRKLKLKPEALDSDASLDLRSDTGLAKSQLLHRLLLINVPWGRLEGSGSSRGTFRENWKLRWDPEFSVRLAEALVYGTTVETAAGNAAVASATKSTMLSDIAETVRGCLHAGLDNAATATIAHLQKSAAASSDIAALAGAVPPLAGILRYGTAREMPTEPLRLLVAGLVDAVCAGLVYACRSLQADAANEMRKRLADLDTAIALLDAEALSADWRRALIRVASDNQAHQMLAGFAVRALYDQGVLAATEAELHLSRALSPSVPSMAAGDWLDGFLGSSGHILLHDLALRGIIDGWLVALGEDDFTNLLPILRRGFSSLDRVERRRLLDEISKLRAATAPGKPNTPGAQPAPMPAATGDEAPGFGAALPLLLTILGATMPTDAPGSDGHSHDQ